MMNCCEQKQSFTPAVIGYFGVMRSLFVVEHSFGKSAPYSEDIAWENL